MEEQFTYDEKRENVLPFGNSLNLLTANKLTYLGDLQDFFGYTDYRALEKFCRDNKIPIVKVGRKKYVVSLLLDVFIEKEITNSLNLSFSNPENMLEAIENNDLEYLKNLIEDSNKSIQEVQTKYNKKNRSKSSIHFKNQLNKA